MGPLSPPTKDIKFLSRILLTVINKITVAVWGNHVSSYILVSMLFNVLAFNSKSRFKINTNKILAHHHQVFIKVQGQGHLPHQCAPLEVTG